ncbi:MAG: pyridoxamine 5'-phosphate oxidase family protein [Candidatus Omnitrophota bacterium]|nr:pyridoxamine 5'-phosphate oxidase family protein [Candidatus Omnitrophota bacterium]
MNKGQIVEFMNNNPVFCLASVEGNKPHVRGMLLYKASEDEILFHTGKTKDLYKQLSVNPQVELCFYSLKDNVQIRVSGKVELIEDLELKKEVVANRDFMKPWVEKSGYDPLAIYRLKKGVVFVWTMATNFEPKEYIEF